MGLRMNKQARNQRAYMLGYQIGFWFFITASAAAVATMVHLLTMVVP